MLRFSKTFKKDSEQFLINQKYSKLISFCLDNFQKQMVKLQWKKEITQLNSNTVNTK